MASLSETSQVVQIFWIFLKSSVGGGLGVLRGRTYSPGRSKMATGQDQVSHYISPQNMHSLHMEQLPKDISINSESKIILDLIMSLMLEQ